MKLEALPWIILFLPLLSAAGITCFALRNRGLSARFSIGAVVTSFVLTVLFIALNGMHPAVSITSTPWFSAGALNVEFGLRLDALSLLMLLVVTGVASLIHIYSAGYMREDPGYPRYFAGLSLFTFSMLGIVLSGNLLMMFVFWELVGVSSYLLIGFWHEKPSAADAAKKAFITNRLGDFGFLLGILILWICHGSLDFTSIQSGGLDKLGGAATAAGLLIFCGAVGKSAQFPLHVWLPDAMEGPTPVSALIHAATMVAAGVYMLCRVFFLFTSDALLVIACIGGFTALLAALIAVQQNDIKRILAYSTLSQLGYMVMAVGLGGPAPAMFHLVTHAFFKALLFLGAGSVILALHHEQDIWKMGGLKKAMPVTHLTFLLGTLALCGVPPFSGFYSKDAILAAAWDHNKLLFVVGVLVAALTTFYMSRLFLIAFEGAPRNKKSHAHESGRAMAWPLRILALMSVCAAFIGIEPLLAGFFGGEAHHATFAEQVVGPFLHAPMAAGCGLLAVFVGFLAARALYAQAKTDPLPALLGSLARGMQNRFYFDELYAGLIRVTQEMMARLADGIDRWIIEGFGIGLVRGGTDLTGRALRLLQTGNVQTYAFLFAAGLALILWFVIGI